MRRLLTVISLLATVLILGSAQAQTGSAAPAAGEEHPEEHPAADKSAETAVKGAEDKKEADKKDEDKKDDSKAKGGGSDEDATVDEMIAAPVKETVIVKLTGLNKLDLVADTYQMEFTLDVTCDVDCTPKFGVNGKITSEKESVHEPRHKVIEMKADLNAEIDTSEFPFDDHVLPLELTDKHNKEAVFEKAEAKMDDKVKLPGWALGEVEGKIAATEEGQSQLTFNVTASRPRQPAFLKTFMPALFLIFVAAFTLLLKPKSAPARLTAATAAIIPAVMFHVGQTNGLPPGGLTRFDKFMFATYFVYLLNAAFAVLLVRSEEAKTEKKSEQLYKVSSMAVPAIAVIAWALVFLKVV